MPSLQKFENLTLLQCTPAQRALKCEYWFVVEAGNSPHTGFHTKEELLEWLEVCGLQLTLPLVAEGEGSFQSLLGTYSRAIFTSYDEFYALPAIRKLKVFDNSYKTLGLLTEDSSGIRTINCLNCNCKFRIEYHWQTGAAMTADEVRDFPER